MSTKKTKTSNKKIKEKSSPSKIEKPKILNETFKVLSIKRVNLNGNYKEKISYTYENKKHIIYNNWHTGKSMTSRKRLARKIVESRVNQSFDESEKRHLLKHKVTPKSRVKEIRKGYYYSGIRAHIVVQYKSTTPLWFPKKNGTTSYTIANNKNEKQMLKALFDLNEEGEYENFVFWLNKRKTDKNVFIYGGYTYKRVFSPTGSFNGDSEYIDFIQRIYKGNSGTQTINRLSNRRTPERRKIKNI